MASIRSAARRRILAGIKTARVANVELLSATPTSPDTSAQRDLSAARLCLAAARELTSAATLLEHDEEREAEND